MKVGILGTGFGAYHASIYKNISSIKSIKIFGRNEEKLANIKADLGIEVTKNIDDILNDPDIDLIDVCLPNHLHTEYVIKALEKGKNVFCETTISSSIEGAEAIAAAENKYGKRVFINLFILFDPSYGYLHQVIVNNELGKLREIHVKRLTPAIWGSLGFETIVTNLMIHDIDFITWILGAPDNISAVGSCKNDDEANVTALFKYSETVAQITGSSMLPKSYQFTVEYEAIFDNGVIMYHEEFSKNGDIKNLIKYTSDGKEEITLDREKNPYEGTIRHVLGCCEKDLDTILSADRAVSSLRTALKIKNLIQ